MYFWLLVFIDLQLFSKDEGKCELSYKDKSLKIFKKSDSIGETEIIFNINR